MYADHSRAYKLIAFMGLTVFVLLWATSFALRSAVKPDERERVGLGASHSPFDAGAALDLAQALRALPVASTPEAAVAAVQDYCHNQARRRNLIFTAGENRPNAAASLLEIPGERSDAILFVVSYSLDAGGTLTVDSAANLAFALEWGASLRKQRGAYTVRLALIHREAAVLTPESASALLSGLPDVPGLGGVLQQVSAVALLDNVADCYLGYRTIAGASQDLQDALSESAQQIGFAQHFQFRRPLPAPLVTLEKPFFLVVDFHGPMSTIEPGQDGEHLCEDSLKATADVLHQALPAMEHQLDRLRVPG